MSILTTAVCTVHAEDLYVAPKGNNTNPGTKEKPLATLTGARNAVRKLISADGGGLKKPINVYFRGGTYRLKETVVFGLEDSGSKDVTITYSAYKDETPVFSGGVPIKGWKKTGLQNGNIWVADVPWTKNGNRFHALFDGEKLLPRSKSPELPSSGLPWDYIGNSKPCNDAILANTKNLNDIEIFMRPGRLWLVNYLPIESYDKTNGIVPRIPPTYSLSGAFYLENTLGYLDEPGEWSLDTHEGKLYYWPKLGKPGENIIAPDLATLIRVEGENDDKGDQDKPVQGIVFRGLTFSHCNRDVWQEDDRGLQHDWDMWDKDNCLLRFRGAEHCFVDKCRFLNTGSGAIRVDLYGQHIRIENNIIRNVGGVGVLLCGYGPGTKNVNRKNTVINNEIEDCGTLFWHSMGVFVWQSGENHIAHNRVYNLGYMGMVFSGVRMRFFVAKLAKLHTGILFRPDRREHMGTIRREETRELSESKSTNWDDYEPFMHARGNIIEYNEIHDCMKRLHDGNCVYLSATGKGNVVRRNFAYSHLKHGMIRTDDDQFDTTVTENITIGNVSVNGLTLKRANTMDNNILVQSYFRGDHWGGGPEAGATIRRNIFYNVAPLSNKHIEPMRLLKVLEKEDIDYNLYYTSGNKDSDQFLMSQQAAGFDKNSLAGDPLFKDIWNLDFSLKPGSPALKLGFKPIEGVETIGLLHDPCIARLRKQGGLDALMKKSTEKKR